MLLRVCQNRLYNARNNRWENPFTCAECYITGFCTQALDCIYMAFYAGEYQIGIRNPCVSCNQWITECGGGWFGTDNANTYITPAHDLLIQNLDVGMLMVPQWVN